MKGKIIDMYNSEAFIMLDDDTIITVPTMAINNSYTIGTTINLSDISNFNINNNNHSVNVINEKLVDFF